MDDMSLNEIGVCWVEDELPSSWKCDETRKIGLNLKFWGICKGAMVCLPCK